jgi:hypothetical protein
MKIVYWNFSRDIFMPSSNETSKIEHYLEKFVEVVANVKVCEGLIERLEVCVVDMLEYKGWCSWYWIFDYCLQWYNIGASSQVFEDLNFSLDLLLFNWLQWTFTKSVISISLNLSGNYEPLKFWRRTSHCLLCWWPRTLLNTCPVLVFSLLGSHPAPWKRHCHEASFSNWKLNALSKNRINPDWTEHVGKQPKSDT